MKLNSKLKYMVTIHSILAKFKSFPFKEHEGVLIIGVDEKAISSYCYFESKFQLLESLLRFFKKNPDLLEVFADAVKFASSSSKKHEKLPPYLQKFLDKILDDIDKLDINE